MTDTEPTLTCPKDGGEKVATAWHSSWSACTWGQRDLWGATRGEHLHRTCQSCGYNWPDPVKA